MSATMAMAGNAASRLKGNGHHKVGPACPDPAPLRESQHRLAANVIQFVRLLRHAGLPVGPGDALAALAAVECVGIRKRSDFYWTLHAALVTDREQHAIFDQAFRMFWRNPDVLRQSLSLMLPTLRCELKQPAPQLRRRLAEALGPEEPPSPERESHKPPEIEIDSRMTAAADETLKTMDFEQMSEAEARAARAAMRRIALDLVRVRTRRFEADDRGLKPDPRRTLRRLVRTGGTVAAPAWRKPGEIVPPLVILCDISGSMSQYSRMVLHFIHALTNARHRVHTFLFGTRLTNVTRQMRNRDVDDALADVGRAAPDWSGGTRIGEAIGGFNRTWARRVLGQRALVLLISDGLERDDTERLDREMARLHRGCHRLFWLNPLLRFDQFAPRAGGVRTMLAHVDDFRPMHNLESLESLAAALANLSPRRPAGYRRWLKFGDHPS